MGRCKKVSTVQPLLLTVSDVAILLGVCKNTVYSLIDKKGLPYVKVGEQRRIHPNSLQTWLKENEQGA